MSARALMTMRATIERNTQTGEDSFGQKGPQIWAVLYTLVPCRAWHGSTGGRHTTAGEYKTVTMDMPGGVFPLGTDVKVGDRVIVTDRQLASLFAGMYVDAVMGRRDHIEVSFRDAA